MDYSNQDAFDIGARLARDNPGVRYDDLVIHATHNREAYDLIQYIDDEELDSLAVYLEDGFYAERKASH